MLHCIVVTISIIDKSRGLTYNLFRSVRDNRDSIPGQCKINIKFFSWVFNIKSQKQLEVCSVLQEIVIFGLDNEHLDAIPGSGKSVKIFSKILDFQIQNRRTSRSLAGVGVLQHESGTFGFGYLNEPVKLSKYM